MSLFSKLSKNNDKTLYPWSQKKLGGSNSALPRAGHAATAVSSEAFIIYGGTHRTSTKKELFYIDANNLSANSINTSGDIPSPRISPVIVAMNGHVLLFGGKPLAHDESYDPGFYLLNLHSKQWTRIQMEGVQPTERSGHSAVAHEGVMYIWGGQNEGNYLNDLFIFNSSTFNTTPRWEQLGYNNECPEPRSGHISQFFENKLFIFGGTDGHRLYDDIWCFDLHTGLWTRIEAEGFNPAARESCASAMVDDVIYIIGGKGENGVELNDLCAYKIRHRRWFRFQNMGPSPSPRHGLTMTAVREKLYVLGGDNETARLDDSSFIFILDSTKIKYPADIPPPQQVPQHQQQQQVPQQQQQQQQQQQVPQQQQQQQVSQQVPQHQQQPAEPPVHQQQFDSSSIEEMNGQPQQYYQQQQQYQQQMQGGQVPQQQYQQNIQQKPFPDQRLQPRPSQSTPTPIPQRTGSSKSGNSVQKEIDTSISYTENVQPSPTSSSNSPNSLTSPRHRSYYPEAQSQSSAQPPARPPRHMSTVPEAALRRPRATSPLPQPESDIAADIRRQYQTPASPNMENSALMYGSPTHGGSLLGSPMAASILSATEDDFVEPQRMMSPPHPVSSRSSPVAPPPRPPREGVGLGNAQRNTMASAANLNRELDDPLRPKSHMVPRNAQPHSPQPVLPTTEHSPQLQQQQLAHEQAQQQLLVQQQQLAQQQQQQQQQQLIYEQQLAHEQAQLLAQQQQYQEHVPERSPSRQIHSTPSPVNRPKQDHAAVTAAAVSAATAAATVAATTAANEERQSLLREIKERDVVISEMKKKENWWRTEVSLARKQRTIKGESFDDGPDADEALLMDIDHLEEDKVKLFEQLVSVKSELRRVRASILQQAQPMSEKVAQADRMRTAALQEAAYFKSKYLALKSHRQDDLKHIEVSRCDDLEKRLAAALIENESNSKMLQQLQKRSQHDQTARVATEERAKEAQERAEEAQQAHQRALEELQVVYNRATKAELQVRDNAVKIADLTHQLSEALMEQPIIKSQEVTEAQLKASQLEAANLKARNDIASLKQKLAESMDDIARLRTILNEREDALNEAKIHVEDCEIQLGMMREALNQQHQKTSVNGFAPTRAY